ncbi:MAG: PAS domain-containing protein [Desulfobulbaceae bacterium]|nr:PAS domain-containing protein [Desulfobulbaceae bacterium]
MFAFPDKTAFQVSKPLLAILLTTLLLTGLLVTNTMRNLSREQKIMESFLLDEGLTLIRSFEAGARTTMMHEMMGGSLPIETLVQETAKAERIAYISIITEDGTVVASTGKHDMTADIALTRKVLESREPVTTIVNEKGREPIFEVAAIFQILPAVQPPGMGMMGKRRWDGKSPETAMLEKGQAVIHLGLNTEELVKVRQQDINHSLFMGGLLLLLGTAGFYFLFLYQGMRVTRTTLANMKLYTRNIIESMPDGMITLDSKGQIVACNPRALDFMEKDMDSLKGNRQDELFRGWPADVLKKDGSVSSFAYTFVHDDGAEVPVEISGSPLLDDQGHDLGAVLLLRDLREIRSMEEQLARSQRLAALGRLAAGIAHEIRNPLGTLRGFAQYFGSRAEDEASKEYSNLMVGEVDRLNEIISSLLQFSRPGDPEFKQVNISELLEKTGKLLEHDFKESNITLQLSDTCATSIEADSDFLLHVLLNLLKNSLNACRKGDSVSLSCEDDEQNIYIAITDNGIGMNREEREQMFDPFFTTRKVGTGLGLAVSHQIVEQHGGSFEVVSSPGQGTTITVTLPKHQVNSRTTHEENIDS